MKWNRLNIARGSLLILASVFIAVIILNHTGNMKIPSPPGQSGPTTNSDNESNGVVNANDDRPGDPFAINIPPMIPTSQTPTLYTSSNAATSRYETPKKATPHQPRRSLIIENDQTYPMRIYSTALTPNDPNANQWWTSATNLPAMWDIPATSTPTLLAIIDTGFGLTHEELADRWYTNPGESGTATAENSSQKNCTDRGLSVNKNCNLIDDNSDGIVDNENGITAQENPSRLNCSDQGKALDKECNRIDDDNNSYIDDITGWDFVNYDNSVQSGEVNDSGTGTTHGTMVAGVAAATGNNGRGIAGVNWQTTLLPIQVIDDDSYGDSFGVGRAIRYAADQGAHVINLSLGSDLSDNYVRSAVQYAIAKGIVVVAASGNDGCNCMIYPAQYPEVVSVGALDMSLQRASFSSYGQNLDIVAPGTNISSSTWTRLNGTSAYASGIAGTSFAAPQVSGLLARLTAQQPTAAPLQLIAALKENANRLTIPINTPQNNLLGFGLLNTQKSVQRMITPRTAELTYLFSPVSFGTTTTPLPQTEVSRPYQAQSCNSETTPGSALYSISNSQGKYLTASEVENNKATILGYTSSLIFYVCLNQPHDISNSYRNINVYREFFNLTSH